MCAAAEKVIASARGPGAGGGRRTERLLFAAAAAAVAARVRVVQQPLARTDGIDCEIGCGRRTGHAAGNGYCFRDISG